MMQGQKNIKFSSGGSSSLLFTGGSRNKKLIFNPSSAEAKNKWAYTSIPPMPYSRDYRHYLQIYLFYCEIFS